MNRFKFLILSAFFMALNAQAAFEVPQGEFACSLTYEETFDIQIVDGQDFPQFLGHLDRPRVKNVTLNFVFSKDGENLDAKLLNPQALPNWLLVNKSQYDNQEGYGFVDSDNGQVFFQVNWNGNWYFGSNVELTTKAFNGRVLKVDLQFNDNDSVGELHKWVKCLKK